MRKEFIKVIEDIFEKNENVVLLLCDIGVYGFRNLKKKYPTRVINIGVLEQSTVSLAAGLAIDGNITFIHTIAPFLVERAFEQIKVDFGYNNLSVNLVSVGGSYDYSKLGATHHSPADVSLLNSIPNSKIFIPGNKKEFRYLLSKNFNNGNINYFRISETVNNFTKGIVVGKQQMIKNSKFKRLIICVGPICDNVILACENIEINILYLNEITHLPISLIKKINPKKIIIIEPYYSGPVLTNLINAKLCLLAKIYQIGVPLKFISKYGEKKQVDKFLKLDTISLSKKIKKILNKDE